MHPDNYLWAALGNGLEALALHHQEQLVVRLRPVWEMETGTWGPDCWQHAKSGLPLPHPTLQVSWLLFLCRENLFC